MKLLRTIAVTFAQYSRIPVPRFEWKEEDMRYSMSAFPLVGAVLGFFFLVVYSLELRFQVPAAAGALLLTAVPVAFTGGFHIDGFMDVADALSSYKSKEEKLAILKDPHIGAFAVIRLALCGLIYIASLIIVFESDAAMTIMCTVASGFVLSRALSAIAVLAFRSARSEGMLYYEATSAAEAHAANLIVVSVWAAASAGLMFFFHLLAGAFEAAASVFCFCWYRYKCYKEFGGITGDTAGWFVVVCETAIAIAAAAASLIA